MPRVPVINRFLLGRDDPVASIDRTFTLQFRYTRQKSQQLHTFIVIELQYHDSLNTYNTLKFNVNLQRVRLRRTLEDIIGRLYLVEGEV